MHPEQASDARVYDYFLGGSHNFAVDRQAARRLLAVLPDHWRAVRENRAFLRRAVTLLLDAGVRQFLDIGSGMPTVGSVHEIARRHDPAARVVYVDVDPVVVEQARALLAGDPGATAIQANLRDPGAILRHPETRRLIDFRRPVGLLLVAVLHFLPDEDDPAGIVARLRDAVAPGSYLVVSHGTTEGCPRPDPALGEFAAELGGPLTSRGRDQIRQLFAGFELLDPGVVWLPQWRPETPFDVGARPERTNMLAAVGQCH